MKKIFFLIPLYFLIGLLLVGCGPTRIYIVRHAEKAMDGSKDPALTSVGEDRAKTLATVLRNRKIERVYATETKRAEGTARPLADLMRKPVLHYSNDTMPQFIIRVLDSAVNTLIVGHSNTILKILLDMGLNSTIKEIGDNEYDNMFIVSLRNQNGRVGYTMKLDETHYGKSSAEKSKR
jgi:broad specificity phosphatase PhoE